jgi:hypothetical protein
MSGFTSALSFVDTDDFEMRGTEGLGLEMRGAGGAFDSTPIGIRGIGGSCLFGEAGLEEGLVPETPLIPSLVLGLELLVAEVGLDPPMAEAGLDGGPMGLGGGMKADFRRAEEGEGGI